MPESKYQTPISRTPPRKTGMENHCDTTWVEAKTVVDISTGETRSYFWCSDDKERFWDKPPRNAGKVIYLKDVAEYNKGNVHQKASPGRGKNAKPTRGRRASMPTMYKTEPLGKKKMLQRKSDPVPVPSTTPTSSQPPQNQRVRAPRLHQPHHVTRTVLPENLPTSDKARPSGKKNGFTSSAGKRKEMLGSIFVMAPKGSLKMNEIVGKIDSSSDRDGCGHNIEDKEKDAFQAKPSVHVQTGGIVLKEKIRGDGDLWVEAKVVTNEITGETRSYFYSKNTQRKVWDEPPSGAGKVIFLKDVKRVYLREKNHNWHKVGNKNDGKTIHKTVGNRQNPALDVRGKNRQNSPLPKRTPTRPAKATAA